MELTDEVSNIERIFYIKRNNINYFVQRLILRQLAPFDWKFLKIVTLRAKDLRSSSFVIRVVLLHICSILFPPTVDLSTAQKESQLNESPCR